MAKETFDRGGKPHVNVGTIGHSFLSSRSFLVPKSHFNTFISRILYQKTAAVFDIICVI